MTLKTFGSYTSTDEEIRRLFNPLAGEAGPMPVEGQEHWGLVEGEMVVCVDGYEPCVECGWCINCDIVNSNCLECSDMVYVKDEDHEVNRGT